MESIETGAAAGQVTASGVVVSEAAALGAGLAEAEVALVAAAHRGDGK